MTKKAELKAVDQQPSDNIENLKKIARSFKNYMNAQYRESIAYNPDSDTIAKVSVSRWLKMPSAIADAMGMDGLPFGVMTQVYGKKDSGKSSMLGQAIAAAQAQGILPILILTEHKFDFNRLATFMGADPEAMLVYPAEDLETGFQCLETILRSIATGKLINVIPNPNFDPDKPETKDNPKEIDDIIDVSNQPCFVFWDSIGGTLSANESEGDVYDWDKDMGRYAQALKKLVKRSSQLLNKVRDKVGVLLLNQVWGKRTPQGITVDQPYGGEAVQHYYALEIHLKRANEIKMTYKGQDMAIGYDIKMEIKKNHITHNRLKGSLIAVAEGLLATNDLESFKKRYRSYLDKE